MNGILVIREKHVPEATTYLLELFHIDIQLASELHFRLGKGRNLGGQILRLFGLIVGLFSLLFVSRQIVLDFAFLCSHQSLKMQLAKLMLLEEGSELLSETGACQATSIIHSFAQDTYSSSSSIFSFLLSGSSFSSIIFSMFCNTPSALSPRSCRLFLSVSSRRLCSSYGESISHEVVPVSKHVDAYRTFIFLFSRVSSRHSFSNFSFMLTVLLSSERP